MQQPAPPPGTPAPHRCAGRIGPPIARRPVACACGVPASPPLGPCGTCRGCCPAIGNGPKIGPRSRGRLYINLFGIAGTLRGRCRKKGRTTGPGRARTAGPCHAVMSRGVVPRPAHAVAPAVRREILKRGCNGLWRTFVRWCGNGRTRHGVCVLGLGSGYNSPSPPARHLQASRLAGFKHCVPVFGIAVFDSPTYLSCYRFYGHFVGVFPNAQKHVVNRWSLCRIAPRFRLVNCGGRCPQSLRVPRNLVCSFRQLYRQPAPKRPLPRFG